MTGDSFKRTIETARQSDIYRYYLIVRDRVLDILEKEQREADRASNYWEEELAGFDYMLDASPLIIQKLREHCYHITGLRSYEYRGHHAHQKDAFVLKLQMLREKDKDSLFVPESPLMGGFGHVIDGVMVNIDTLKFYESLIAMNKAGLLTPFRAASSERKVAIEIGAGWGGFAYQFKTLFPHTCYVIIDLPQTLLFSAVYLKALFPNASMLFYGEKPFDRLFDGYENYDFIFLPHFSFAKTQLTRVDLAINIASFQEMTTGQVAAYTRKLAELKCPYLYSHNRDRSSHNDQLSTVNMAMSEYYDVSECKILDLPYTNLPTAKQKTGISGLNPIIVAKKGASRLFCSRPLRRARPVWDYRHLVGTLKTDTFKAFTP